MLHFSLVQGTVSLAQLLLCSLHLTCQFTSRFQLIVEQRHLPFDIMDEGIGLGIIGHFIGIFPAFCK